MALYVVSIFSFYFIHVVDVSSLSICIVLRAFVVFSICWLYISSEYMGRERVLVFLG